MRPSKTNWFPRLQSLTILIFLITFSSCTCDKQKGKGGKGNTKRVFVMLIHGINDMNPRTGESNLTDAIEKFKEKLEGDKHISSLDVFAPARKNSMTAPIKDQAEDMFKLIQGKGITQDDKLILIANSQGGAVAMAMYAMYMKDWENLAIISVQGALCGTPAIKQTGIPPQVTQDIKNIIDYVRDNTDEVVNSIQIKMQDGSEQSARNPLRRFGQVLDLNKMIQTNLPEDNKIEGEIRGWLELTKDVGGTDLDPASQFMQDLRKAMPNPVPIRMLLIAGQVDDFVKCMARLVLAETVTRAMSPYAGMIEPFMPSTALIDGMVQAVSDNKTLPGMLLKLKPAWDQLVANGEPNDLLIPIESQLGVGLIDGARVEGQDKYFPDFVHSRNVIIALDKEVDFIKRFIND